MMDKKLFLRWVVVLAVSFMLGSCGLLSTTSRSPGAEGNVDGSSDVANGERIYFTATSVRDARISYRGGPNFGGMMMGRYLTCASCHGPEAHGGTHVMHMQVMDAPDITYDALTGEAEEHASGEGDEAHEDEHAGYDLEDFRMAVVEGKHPDGESLSREMPRWQMSDQDLADLFAFLKSLSD